MSQHFDEGAIGFDFPDGWNVCRPGESSFYLRHFQKFCGGSKETDFLLYDPGDRILWMIEVKDYRANERTKQSDLADELAEKTRDSLALLKAAAVNDMNIVPAAHRQVGTFARLSSAPAQIRVVLHCELPASPSKLFPSIKDAANLQTKMDQKLRPVDPHVLFTNVRMARALPWTVTA